jgi:hypothetical protein
MVILDRCGSVTAIGARARDLKKSAESAGSMCDTPQARHSCRLTDLATEILEHARDMEQRFASGDISRSATNQLLS